MFDCIKHLRSTINNYEGNTYFNFMGNTFIFHAVTNINLYPYKFNGLVKVFNFDEL